MNFSVYDTSHDSLVSPYERAKLVYEVEQCARSFVEDLFLHLSSGYVHSTPRLFLMGRPVCRRGDIRDVVDPRVTFSNPDCWHIYLAAGELSEFFKFEPFELPWFSWERNNRLRFYQRERVIEYVSRYCSVPVQGRSGQASSASASSSTEQCGG